jgi:hypothetical protein
MRCRKHRYADQHSSQIDFLRDHIVKTNSPRPLTTAIVKASQAETETPTTKPRYRGTIPFVQTHSSERRSPTKMLSAGAACTPAQSPETSKVCTMLTVPGAATTATPMLSASPAGTPSSSLLFDRVENQWILRNEALHGRDDAECALFHRKLVCAKATRLYAKVETLLALDRPILSRPLTTILYLPATKGLYLLG